MPNVKMLSHFIRQQDGLNKSRMLTIPPEAVLHTQEYVNPACGLCTDNVLYYMARYRVSLQRIPNQCELPGNDIVDTLAKVASNLPSSEESTTYQQAVAEIRIKRALLA